MITDWKIVYVNKGIVEIVKVRARSLMEATALASFSPHYIDAISIVAVVQWVDKCTDALSIEIALT